MPVDIDLHLLKLRLLLGGAVLGAILALAACASAPPKPPDPAETLKQYSASGYQPARQFDIVTQRETWTNGSDLIDVSLTVPSSADGRVPLIVYLPGLGESTDAGALWRDYWARAGYAVLLVQPTTLGVSLWEGSRARAGDFYDLAKEQFDPATLPGRLKIVSFAINEISRRAAAGAAPYRGIETARFALAGFDLGAQTVVEAAADNSALHQRVSAVLLLGALEGPARSLRADAQQRRADVHVPIMSLTGYQDEDPYGFKATPLQRETAWQNWPPGNKYLLMLAGGSHALLSGRSLIDPDAAVPFSRDPNPRGAGSSDSGSGDAKSSGRRGGRRGNNTQSSASEPQRPAAILDLHQIAAVQNISLAFLDATMKASASARQWLEQQSRVWIGAQGVLSAR